MEYAFIILNIILSLSYAWRALTLEKTKIDRILCWICSGCWLGSAILMIIKFL